VCGSSEDAVLGARSELHARLCWIGAGVVETDAHAP
jgi:hypothetical protein